MLDTVHVYVLGKVTWGTRLIAPQVVTDVVVVITGVGYTVTVTEAAIPVHPFSDVGITEYTTVSGVLLLELVRASGIEKAGTTFGLALPMSAPFELMVHTNVLTGVAGVAERLRLMFPAPLHTFAEIALTVGVIFTASVGDILGVLTQPRPG
jgi:hypothetical protein